MVDDLQFLKFLEGKRIGLYRESIRNIGSIDEPVFRSKIIPLESLEVVQLHKEFLQSLQGQKSNVE